MGKDNIVLNKVTSIMMDNGEWVTLYVDGPENFASEIEKTIDSGHKARKQMQALKLYYTEVKDE